MARRRLLAILAGVAVLLTAATSGAYGGAVRSDADGGPTGPLAAEMAEVLELQPGGVQVSDNAMAWDGGDVVIIWPSPGEDAAPAGLGGGVRGDLVAELGLAHLAGPEPAAHLAGPQAAGDMVAMGSVTSCPPAYYCFYTGTNFDGARYQFSSTCSAYASSYGFDNTTSSWVNRNFAKVVYAYDYRGGGYLWTMGAGANDPYVGSADNNRMSYWTCGSA